MTFDLQFSIDGVVIRIIICQCVIYTKYIYLYRRLKEKRKAQQEENVKRKQKEKEDLKQKAIDGMKKKKEVTESQR